MLMKSLKFTVDKRLRIRSWSGELEVFTGMPASFALGKKYSDIFPPLRLHDKDAVAETFRRGRTVSLKNSQFRCLSLHRQADIRISPLREGDTVVNRAQIVLHPAKPCEVGRQLIDSQKLIAIGKIAATLGHGVRNPLNAIKGAVVYLRDRYSHEKPLIEFTEILEAEIARLENFISGFLSTTTFDCDVGLIDVNEMIRKIKVFISLQTYSRGIRCEYALAQTSPVRISAFHMEQAVLNIINNSIEAMQNGGTLTIKTFPVEDATPSCAAIEIADTGSGIESPAEVDHLPNHGRGFGLFIANEIIKGYGGRLKIRSEPGKGTAVTFLLPVQKAAGGDNP